MIVTRKSTLDGKAYDMDIPLTDEQLRKGVAAYNDGAFIQDAFPTLNAEQREFLLTGITPEIWDHLIGSDDE